MAEGDISIVWVIIFLIFMMGVLPGMVFLIGNKSRDASFRRDYNREMMRRDIRDRDRDL